MQIDLSGKVALVTGASGDLGRVMVRTLAACGADVAVHYHVRREEAESLHREIVALGRRACAVQADVADPAGVRDMRDLVAERLGDPDIVVNNAVAQYPWKHLLDQPLEDYESQFRSSVLHNVIMAQVFVPAMIRRRWGRVIGINTECSAQCHPNQSAYVTGKHGMNGALQVLAKEVGEHQVTVNQVAPGWMISDRDRRKGTERQDAYERRLPLRHRGDDQDIANAVAFLASDLARFITGVVLPVDGGGTTLP